MCAYRPSKVRVEAPNIDDLKSKESGVEKFYDAVSKNYYESHKGRFCDDILEYFIKRFLPPPPLKILDLGGGVGRFAIPLAKMGYLVLLNDISKKMLESARELAGLEKVNLSFKEGTVTNLTEIARNSMDVIICMNSVLNYCDDYMCAFSEAHRVLKPGSLFIGSVNNLFKYAIESELKHGDLSLFEKSMETGNRKISWGDTDLSHITHEFTYPELLTALKAARFQEIKILGVFNLLGKYFSDEEFLKRIDIEAFMKLQFEFAHQKEYVNNSMDFFFVCNK